MLNAQKSEIPQNYQCYTDKRRSTLSSSSEINSEDSKHGHGQLEPSHIILRLKNRLTTTKKARRGCDRKEQEPGGKVKELSTVTMQLRDWATWLLELNGESAASSNSRSNAGREERQCKGQRM